MPLAPASRFGAYEIIARLGAGGMGEVWRARDPRLERGIALKVLPSVSAADETARSRLLREARMAAKLNHPNVCTVHEVGEAEGQAYIAMELVAGQALSDRLAAGRLPIEQAEGLGRQIADAVAHAHEQGVVHRDLKPGNVIVTPEGRAKVLDFGLAKPLLGRDLEAATTLTQASLTEAGSIVGTLAYMAPEQLRGKPADARSDVWALGVVLYEMAAGRRPFGGDTGFELSSAILNQPPKPLPATVPPPLAGIIERCLAKEPLQRYQRGGEVRSALEALQQGAAPAAWPGWRASLVAHRWPVVIASASALLVVVAGLDVGGVRSRVLGRGEGRAIRMAILPFANLSGDPEQEYLSDGLTQEMIAQLGRLHPEHLSVIARTSVMRYKKAETPVDQIGRELNVDYVLEGSARREGDRIRISAELIHVGDQTQLWADTYERELAGILALQADVARKVAESLALKLLPAEKARLATVRSVVPEAYEAYLKGKQAHSTMSKSGFETAERCYTLALEKDPSFAAAWAGMARVWTGRQQLSLALPTEAVPKAKAATLKALQLDGEDFEAHRALAGILTWSDWDWPAAEQEWNKLLALDPNHVDFLSAYSHFLMNMGRGEEALRTSTRALELDPFSVRAQGFHAMVLVGLRRYDDALAVARLTLRQQTDTILALNVQREVLHLKGLYDEVLASERVRYAGDRELIEALDRGLAEAGYSGARRRFAEVQVARFGKPGGLGAYAVAVHFVVAGEPELALEWLGRGYETRDPNMPYLGSPIWDPVRSDPRFQDLLRRMNLPVVAQAVTPAPARART